MAKRKLEFDTKEPISIREKLLIIGLYEEGNTDAKVAKILKISRKTLQKMVEASNLKHTIKNIKLKPNKLVELSLYQRARGFEYVEEKDDGEVITKTKKYVPPDTTACIYWTKNRDPERWRDKFDHEVNGNIVIKV